MGVSELSIHLPKLEIPSVHVVRYAKDKTGPGFTVIKMTSKDSPAVSFFVHSLQDVVNFKNNCLCACEKHIKEQTP